MRMAAFGGVGLRSLGGRDGVMAYQLVKLVTSASWRRMKPAGEKMSWPCVRGLPVS